MTRKTKSFKFFSVLTLVIFTFTSFLEAAPVAYTLQVPKQYGTITKRYHPGPAASQTQPTVVYIQDAHTNLSAQENIRHIIDTLEQEQGVNQLAMEGTYGELDLAMYRDFPFHEIKERVFTSQMKQGKINGAELSAILARDSRLQAVGAEDAVLFLTNYEDYLAALSWRNQLAPDLAKIENAINTLKPRLFSERLMDAEGLIQDFHQERVEVTDYLERLMELAREAGIALSDYTHLDAFLKAANMTAGLQPEAALIEREALLSVLADEMQNRNEQAGAKALKQELKQTAGKSFDVWKPEVHRFVFNKAQEYDVPSYTYDAFFRKAEAMRLLAGLDLSVFSNEITSLGYAVLEALAATEDEKELLRLLRHHEVFKTVITLRATPDQVDAFKKDAVEFLPEKTEALSNRLSGERGLVLSRNWDKAIAAAMRFYEGAAARNQALVDNTLAMARQKQSAIVPLVAGGFHAEGIQQALLEEGVPYVVVTPNLTQGLNELPYEAKMTGSLFASDMPSLSKIVFVAQNVFAQDPSAISKFPNLSGFLTGMRANLSGTSVGELTRESIENLVDSARIEGVNGQAVFDPIASWISQHPEIMSFVSEQEIEHQTASRFERLNPLERMKIINSITAFIRLFNPDFKGLNVLTDAELAAFIQVIHGYLTLESKRMLDQAPKSFISGGQTYWVEPDGSLMEDPADAVAERPFLSRLFAFFRLPMLRFAMGTIVMIGILSSVLMASAQSVSAAALELLNVGNNNSEMLVNTSDLLPPGLTFSDNHHPVVHLPAALPKPILNAVDHINKTFNVAGKVISLASVGNTQVLVAQVGPKGFASASEMLILAAKNSELRQLLASVPVALPGNGKILNTYLASHPTSPLAKPILAGWSGSFKDLPIVALRDYINYLKTPEVRSSLTSHDLAALEYWTSSGKSSVLTGSLTNNRLIEYLFGGILYEQPFGLSFDGAVQNPHQLAANSVLVLKINANGGVMASAQANPVSRSNPQTAVPEAASVSGFQTQQLENQEMPLRQQAEVLIADHSRLRKVHTRKRWATKPEEQKPQEIKPSAQAGDEVAPKATFSFQATNEGDPVTANQPGTQFNQQVVNASVGSVQLFIQRFDWDFSAPQANLPQGLKDVLETHTFQDFLDMVARGQRPKLRVGVSRGEGPDATAYHFARNNNEFTLTFPIRDRSFFLSVEDRHIKTSQTDFFGALNGSRTFELVLTDQDYEDIEVNFGSGNTIETKFVNLALNYSVGFYRQLWRNSFLQLSQEEINQRGGLFAVLGRDAMAMNGVERSVDNASSVLADFSVLATRDITLGNTTIGLTGGVMAEHGWQIGTQAGAQPLKFLYWTSIGGASFRVGSTFAADAEYRQRNQLYDPSYGKDFAYRGGVVVSVNRLPLSVDFERLNYAPVYSTAVRAGIGKDVRRPLGLVSPEDPVDYAQMLGGIPVLDATQTSRYVMGEWRQFQNNSGVGIYFPSLDAVPNGRLVRQVTISAGVGAGFQFALQGRESGNGQKYLSINTAIPLPKVPGVSVQLGYNQTRSVGPSKHGFTGAVNFTIPDKSSHNIATRPETKAPSNEMASPEMKLFNNLVGLVQGVGGNNVSKVKTSKDVNADHVQALSDTLAGLTVENEARFAQQIIQDSTFTQVPLLSSRSRSVVGKHLKLPFSSGDRTLYFNVLAVRIKTELAGEAFQLYTFVEPNEAEFTSSKIVPLIEALNSIGPKYATGNLDMSDFQLIQSVGSGLENKFHAVEVPVTLSSKLVLDLTSGKITFQTKQTSVAGSISSGSANSAITASGIPISRQGVGGNLLLLAANLFMVIGQFLAAMFKKVILLFQATSRDKQSETIGSANELSGRQLHVFLDNEAFKQFALLHEFKSQELRRDIQDMSQGIQQRFDNIFEDLKAIPGVAEVILHRDRPMASDDDITNLVAFIEQEGIGLENVLFIKGQRWGYPGSASYKLEDVAVVSEDQAALRRLQKLYDDQAKAINVMPLHYTERSDFGRPLLKMQMGLVTTADRQGFFDVVASRLQAMADPQIQADASLYELDLNQPLPPEVANIFRSLATLNDLKIAA